MPWRFALMLLICLAGLNLSQTQASPQSFSGPLSTRQNGFENDNNYIDNLFQNFNGNESSDGGTVKNVSIGPLPKPVSAPAEVTSATEAYGRARVGREATIALANDRVVVRVPAGLTDDLEVSIKVVKHAGGRTAAWTCHRWARLPGRRPAVRRRAARPAADRGELQRPLHRQRAGESRREQADALLARPG